MTLVYTDCDIMTFAYTKCEIVTNQYVTVIEMDCFYISKCINTSNIFSDGMNLTHHVDRFFHNVIVT